MTATQTPAGVTEEGSSIAPAGFHGVIDGLDEQEYHRHPALSASGAKKLLPPSCPARFKWERDNGQPPKRVFDFGRAAHAAVLGVGSPIGVVAAPDWRSKVAKERGEALRAEGFTPLLEHEADQVYGMAAALREHPLASALLNPDRGKPEQSLFWRDFGSDVDCRGRLDWLPDSDGGRLIISDFKTCQSAEPGAIRRAAASYGYHQQAAFYMDGVRALGLADDVAFVFIFQEKTAPYLVTVAELDDEAIRVGRALNDRAMQVFRDCSATGTWPGYSDDVELISLPGWATYVPEEFPA